MFGSIRNLFQHEAPELVAEGRLVDSPRPSEKGSHRIEFGLDTHEDIIFCQEITGLTAPHKRGETIRVHYRLSKEDPKFGEVDWIESAAL